MGYIAIGRKGEPARLLVMDVEDAKKQAAKDEVCVTVPSLGAWIISSDGASAAAEVETEAKLWMAVRGQRDTLLASCDWTQMPDVPEATRSAWVEYRQALRDITNQSNPAQIAWPTPPQGEPV